eukprot:TRINITY_DN1365_c0_g1_i2.p1 TRINITY_DN1365_c0_g1~~TRINITY_DN1365_c0_g1_i2.p1  ORF type:complete len:125 (+),score=29.18 TRINITY_DN1365_c0_g1_i2:68-442(+)
MSFQKATLKDIDFTTQFAARQKAVAEPEHPIKKQQELFFQQQEDLNDLALANVFGSHMVLRLKMEKKILSSLQRLPVLQSEFLGYDIITKRDEQIYFGDYHRKKGEGEDFPGDVHELIEAKLKL